MTGAIAPGQARRGLLAGLAVASLLAHLGLLGLLTGEPPPAGRRPADGAASSRPRSVVVRSAPIPDDDASEPLPLPRRPPPQATERAAQPPPGTTPHDEVPSAAPAASSPHQTPALTGPALAGPDDGAEYLPRSALSVVPQPLGEVLLTYPPGAPPGRHRGELTLFIDEQGSVQRVRIDSGEAELPAVFQAAARQAFLAARFTPGELQGRAVKARMRIAVEFEAAEAPEVAEDRGPR